MGKPKEVILSVTNRCNLKCRMCDIPQSKIDELSTSQWKKVMEEALLIGAETIVFSGGEPLLRDDIFELISFANKNHMKTCLTSNGFVIDNEVAHKLSESGIDVVNISVEGSEEAHDYLRGKGVFEKALSALKNLKEYNIESTIATMVSKHNYEYMPHVVELAREYNATTVRFQPFSEIFMKGAEAAQTFLIDKKDIKKIENTIERTIGLCEKYKIAANPVNYLRKMPFYLSGEKTAPRDGCSALWTSCPVNAKGDVFPCWVVAGKDKTIGNVVDSGLSKLWGSARHDYIRKAILTDGCPRCMMSCYDEVFDGKKRESPLSRKAGKIWNWKSYKGFAERSIRIARGSLLRLRLRYNFYRSYRGSLKKIVGRISKNLKRKLQYKKMDNKSEMERSLEEISLSREKLRREIKRYK